MLCYQDALASVVICIIVSHHREFRCTASLNISDCCMPFAFHNAEAVGADVIDQTPEGPPEISSGPRGGAAPLLAFVPAVNYPLVVHPNDKRWQS